MPLLIGTFAYCHYVVSATRTCIAATETELANCQKCNDLLSNYHFQPAAIETTGVYGESTSPFLAALPRNLLIFLVNPMSDSVSTSVCPWLWPGGTLAAYWLACQFDLILAVPSVLTSITVHHLPLFNAQALLSAYLRFLTLLFSPGGVLFRFPFSQSWLSHGQWWNHSVVICFTSLGASKARSNYLDVFSVISSWEKSWVCDLTYK